MKVFGLAVLTAALSLTACSNEPPPGEFKKWGREKGYAMGASKKKKAEAKPTEGAEKAIPPSVKEEAQAAETDTQAAETDTQAAETDTQAAETDTQAAVAETDTQPEAAETATQTAAAESKPESDRQPEGAEAATAEAATAEAGTEAAAAPDPESGSAESESESGTAAAAAKAESETAAAAAKAESEAAAPATEKASYDEAAFAQGKKLFGIHCVACHQASGQGLAGAFPPLVGSEWVLEDPRRPAAIVIRGLMGKIEVKGKTYNNVMAPLGATLKDEQIASVLTYVRNAWGNSASGVDASLVANVRKALKGKNGMWQGGDAVTEFVQSMK